MASQNELFYTCPVYYSNTQPFWSIDGCHVMSTTDRYTICSCNHLTHFAVLFDARGTSSKVNGSINCGSILIVILF